jgi:hypothetical protein
MSATTEKQTRIQSPSYPSLALKDAIAAVAKIDGRYRLSSVDRVDAARLLGYTGMTGPSNMALAALSWYGLVEKSGKGELRVTERARSILHPASEEEKKSAVRDAALSPQLYRDLRERFPDIPVPPEDGVVTYLNRQGFNPTAVRPAARAFLSTMAYLQELKVSESRGRSDDKGQESAPSAGSEAPLIYGGARVGDLVQWESNGVLCLEKPLRVRFVSDDGRWVAVEGSETGIPMEQVIVEGRAQGWNQQADRPRIPFATGLDIRDGEDLGTDLRFKLGKGIVVQIRSQKELGADDLEKLLALLTAQRDALKD